MTRSIVATLGAEELVSVEALAVAGAAMATALSSPAAAIAPLERDLCTVNQLLR
jgi:hypothetical protein